MANENTLKGILESDDPPLSDSDNELNGRTREGKRKAGGRVGRAPTTNAQRAPSTARGRAVIPKRNLSRGAVQVKGGECPFPLLTSVQQTRSTAGVVANARTRDLQGLVEHCLA